MGAVDAADRPSAGAHRGRRGAGGRGGQRGGAEPRGGTSSDRRRLRRGHHRARFPHQSDCGNSRRQLAQFRRDPQQRSSRGSQRHRVVAARFAARARIGSGRAPLWRGPARACARGGWGPPPARLAARFRPVNDRRARPHRPPSPPLPPAPAGEGDRHEDRDRLSSTLGRDGGVARPGLDTIGQHCGSGGSAGGCGPDRGRWALMMFRAARSSFGWSVV